MHVRMLLFSTALVLGYPVGGIPVPALAAPESGAPPPVTVRTNAEVLTPYAVFELTLRHDRVYAHPFFDVTVEVTFRSPGGRSVRIGGFLYGSAERPEIEQRWIHTPRGDIPKVTYRYARPNLWKARFAPGETGKWTYQWTFANAAGERAEGKGTFTCVPGRRHARGFVRRNPENPLRWVLDDGSPFFPIGLQNGWSDGSGNGTFMDRAGLEGPFRLDRDAPLPEGPLFVRGPSMNPLNFDVYARRFASAGFNCYRYSQRNNTPPLYDDLDHWRVHEAVMTDELLARLRKYGFRIFYGFFGFGDAYRNEPENREAMEKVKRFLEYSVDRWGAYVDFWEFLNEREADPAWLRALSAYVKAIDPYRHPVTSWKAGSLPGIDFTSPHWYTRNRDPRRSLEITERLAREWKQNGKPVLLGEAGNSLPRGPRAPGEGGVWDPTSPLRMRIRNWTALFTEIAFVFWNTSYARDGHTMNIWLGPEERQYVKAGQDFADRLDAEVRPVELTVSAPEQARALALASRERAGVYLFHHRNPEKAISGLTFTLGIPRDGTAYWYRPRDAAILGTVPVKKGRHTFEAPPFAADLALLVTPDGPPDIDHDGVPNDADPDDDNDGVPDVNDAFPLEPWEWADQDGDRIGDHLDADRDGDGIADDGNGNGIPDRDEPDLDKDGVPCRDAVPWDAFPFDASEWRDTDGDGIGDNRDPDDDGDGWTDAEEQARGTDPLDPLRFPLREKG